MTRAATIFAEATPSGAGALAVIRISGPQARQTLGRLGASVPEPRKAALRHLKGEDGQTLDHALVLFFPGPNSYTGEDVVELHVHGGRAVRRAVLGALASMPGVTPAEPGAFTRRAFEAGRLDLTQAEAVADLVAAETEAQRRQALRQLDGGLSARSEAWREVVLGVLADMEAHLDFSDEAEVEASSPAVADPLTRLLGEITEELAAGHRGERIREGIEVAVVGPPNAGKSSLVNALARREVAIVADSPGTTRDVIEVSLDLGGFAITLCDTAGLRETTDTVEKEGVRRALDRAAAADLSVMVLSGPEIGELSADLERHAAAADLVLVNKVDLLERVPAVVAGQPAIPVSVRSGKGLDRFEEVLAQTVAARYADTVVAAPVTRLRHRDALEQAASALARALGGDMATAPELVTEDVRLAARHLGRIAGRVDVEDVLDRIFSGFCIGK
ncbi:tRNA uridine-5-carboxymethylaminomethyl(34) synthesis GTPase MnmE [Roseospirillum parvum]|uniref:tRNA modification GTPase MnmE n=1 Tax=Roseospirillum parvum TaxID=83401 RepID=A0A1G8DT89_9PROT|nr:tRNA uridine-5-carboxymethylaminomethyl(34) synthesis GTPase MnmE [Roseospirillum parvum]SDH60649.1 tRNA modification GTPase [Roseospirillum parvum]